MASEEIVKIQHPVDTYFHDDASPTVWCSGCGIGTVVYAFLKAVQEAGCDLERMGVVSGLGCTGKLAEYLNMKSSTATTETVIRSATKLSDENPESRVVVFSNNADFLLSGAQDMIEMKGRDAKLLVIHVNNFLYFVTERGAIAATPLLRLSADGRFELPFNIPYLAVSSGATYVARWTPFHAGWLRYSIADALVRDGLSVIEVISPCLMYYTGDRRIGDPVERMKFYDDHTVMEQSASLENLDIRADEKIIIGKFVDER